MPMIKDDKAKRKIRRAWQFVNLGLKSLQNDGVSLTAKKTVRVLGLGRTRSYRRWARTPLYTEAELNAQREQSFDKDIKFSIITPLFNTPEEYLRDAIESAIAQTYSNWELCLADGSDAEHDYVERVCREYADKDARVKYKRLDENYGIAGNSNACIEMADGDYISILDHDDVLHPAALHDVMEVICKEDADFVYTDETTFRESNLSKVVTINFKKDFMQDDLMVNNYICHFTSFKRELTEKCGAFCEGFDGSQDHELFLRLTDAAEKVAHVPKPLYYWRAHGESVAQSGDNKSYAAEAGKKAVRKYLKTKGVEAEADNAREGATVYRVSYKLPEEKPAVRIIIPNYDHAEDLRVCLDSIFEKTHYPNYRITIVENNSKYQETFDYYDALCKDRDNIEVIKWPGTGFNWSAINNYAVGKTDEEYLLFLNNDTEVITPEWIEEMLMHAARPEIGAVGAMLYFPDNRVQHAGVIIGLGGVAGHVFSGAGRGDPGYMSRMSYAQNMSAVTGACMMVRRDAFEAVGRFDEELAVGYNDIDFCLKLVKAGYRNLWTPYAELYHYESKSRGVYDSKESRDRTWSEKEIFAGRWADILEKGDPCYNNNFSLIGSSFALKQQDGEEHGRCEKKGSRRDNKKFKRLLHRAVEKNAAAFKIYSDYYDAKKRDGSSFETEGTDIDLLSEYADDPTRSILFVTHELTLTGAPLALLGLIKVLKRKGFKPLVVSCEDGRLKDQFEEEEIPVVVLPKEKIPGVISRGSHLFTAVIVNTIECAPVIRELNGKDIPVIWWIHEAKAVYGMKNAQNMPRKLADNIHVFCAGEYAEKVLKARAPKYKTEILLYGAKDMSLCTDPRDDEVMTELSGTTDNTDAIASAGMDARSNDAPTSRDTAARNNSPKEDAPSNCKKRFLSVGAIGMRKGQDILLDAIEMLSDDVAAASHFVFAGKSEDESIRERIIAKSMENPELVSYRGELSPSEMAELYRTCDFIICSSRDDPMPVVIAEAMSLGIPSICSSHTGSARIIRKNEAGKLYYNNNPKRLAASIAEAFEIGDEEYRKMSANARKAYDEYFSEQVFETNTEKILALL